MAEIDEDDSTIKKIKQWVNDNNYTLIGVERADGLEGPVAWSARMSSIKNPSILQIKVYRITVGNQKGEMIQGWLKINYWVTDIASAEIEVLWDSDKPPLYSDSKGVGWINRMTVIAVVIIYALILIFLHPQPYKIWDVIIGMALYGIVVMVRNFTT